MRTTAIYRTLALALFCLAAAAAGAQGVKTVTGEAVFYGEDSHSLADCKRLSLEAARLDALAREYGTIVESVTTNKEEMVGDRELSAFSALSSTEVKGEWIADEGEPLYEVSLDNDGRYIVRCRVRGKTRSISNQASDFQALVLKNGKEQRFADTFFKSGDSMYVYFKAPTNGYVAVYLASADGMVYTLLPYLSTSTGKVPVKGNREYVFFDRDDRQFGKVDAMRLRADDGDEYNQLYVIFSPNEFTKAVDSYTSDRVPRSLTFKDFSRWLSDKRKRDPKMGVKQVNLLIQDQN